MGKYPAGPKAYKTAAIVATGGGNATIVSAVTGMRIKVYAMFFNVEGTVGVKWIRGSTDLTGVMTLEAREGYTGVVDPPAFILATNAGEALILNTSAAVNGNGWIAYWDSDPT